MRNLVTGYLDGERIFRLHDDVRHVIVADSMGNVVKVFSRAKREWPPEVQRQFSGLMAAIVIGLSEKVRDIAGEVEYVFVSHGKLNIVICKSPKNYLYLVSTRKSIPWDMVARLVGLIKEEG